MAVEQGTIWETQGTIVGSLCVCEFWEALNIRKPLFYNGFVGVVAGGGIEPPTQGFSVLCSTN